MERETPGFSGHETFPFRYGWLKKGVDAVSNIPDIFAKDEALIYLGVGKNMVRSIRHWCLAAGLLHEQRSGGGGHLSVTPFGAYLFGDEGADPYLEDTGTLWLLHWRIATNARRATTWFWAFSHWHQPDFRKEWIVKLLMEAAGTQGWQRVAESSVLRDVDCFVRTYVPSRTTKTLLTEDTLDCPLVELDLVNELPDHRTYRFVRGSKPSLPDGVFLYAMVEYWMRWSPKSSAASLEQLMHAPGSPGRIFQLDEISMVERLEDLQEITGGVYSYRESAGIKQVFRTSEHIELEALLHHYYQRVGA